MKGGVFLKPSWNDRDITAAVTYFLENAKFRILTNSSISCITLIAKLNAGIETPFISISSLDFAKDVTSLLLKVMPSIERVLTPGRKTDKAMILGRVEDYNGIEINSFHTIDEEARIQKDIYRQSIVAPTTYLDGLCPALVHLMNPVPDKNVLRGYFTKENVTPRNGKLLAVELILIKQVLQAINNANDKQSEISIILMEFMEGYDVLDNFKTHPRYNVFAQYALFELDRLHMFGYYHGDSHTRNIMVHPDIPCFTVTNEERHRGSIKIIDFGRTQELSYEHKLMIRRPDYDYSLVRVERFMEFIFPNAPNTDEFVNVLKDILRMLSTKRAEFVKKIVNVRLIPFYEFSEIPEGERRPPNLLKKLFPAEFIGGLLLKTRLNTPLVTNTTVKMLATTDSSIINSSYDWDAGRPIMSTALSEKEQKMTLEDFKRVFQGVFLQNDTEKTLNVAALLNKTQEEYSIRGGKMMKKKNKTKKRKIKKIYKKKSKKVRK
jgi:hypothetical protein